MKPRRVLDLCCGAGGAAMGLHRAWPDAEIVGVDIKPQPRYPFTFVQADALWYLTSSGAIHDLDFVWVSPPCQAWASGYNPRRAEYPMLIAPLREALSGRTYVIENVPKAPLLDCAVMVCGGALGCANHEMQIHRHRKFEATFPVVGTTCENIRDMVCTVTGSGTPSGFYYKYGRRSVKLAERREVMGIDWMTAHELSEAVPPAYSEYIARQLPA